MHICRYYHDDELLPQALREQLETGLYELFVGQSARLDPESRRGDHDVVADPAGRSGAPDPVRATIARLAGTLTLSRFTAGNARLSERLAHEAVHWVTERWASIDSDDAFSSEEAEIETWLALDDPDALADAAVGRRPELTALATVVRNAARRSDSDAQHRRQTAGMALIVRRWRDRLERDRANHQERLLGRALGGFIRELQELVPRLEREQRLVRDIYGNEDALWDLTRHDWEVLPVLGLEEASRTLADHPDLVRLAEILGKSRSVTERRSVERVERSVRLRPMGIGKSEITGVRTGDDLSSLLASEAALLAHPETEDLFFAKLAHRELLVLDYNTRRIVEDVRLRTIRVTQDVPVERGPVVVCVDTSGSMLGLPEKIAKAAVLALARRLEIDRRRVEVIAFSSQVRSFTMDHQTTGLLELARFLDGGFHGGTDLGKALVAALDALERSEYRHGDVLVISDFRVPKIADRFLSRITAQHRRGTLFHSLTVARGPVVDPLHLFDSSWLLSTESGSMVP